MQYTKAFTYPFCYTATPSVVSAAETLMEKIRNTPDLHSIFKEGKMLGVLLCADKDGKEVFLFSFSGLAGGKSIIDGFVPPIFDLTAPEGHFKTKEAELSELNRQIREMEALEPSELSETSERSELTEESKTNKTSGKTEALANTENHKEMLHKLKEKRKMMSADLQEWIFRQYKVLNAQGECKNIFDIFSERGLIPPGGTGDCAAPKLLQSAYLHGLTPLAMGEFWYGDSPSREIRHHGRFYPACTGKCGPLLSYMLEGLTTEPNPLDEDKSWLDLRGKRTVPEILYEDDWIIIVNKPSGMLSVPGRNGKKKSLQEWLQEHLGTEVYSCHRLDMDTSGLLVYAKDAVSQACIQEQFATHQVKKTYIARLSATAQGKTLKKGHRGTIALPLMLDYYDRPRQMVDFTEGKKAVTEYEVIDLLPGGEVDIRFTPLTGRTHQLRVHSAHPQGLGRPILGDRLYGGVTGNVSRLCLHADTLSFRHPEKGEMMTFTKNGNGSLADEIEIRNFVVCQTESDRI